MAFGPRLLATYPVFRTVRGGSISHTIRPELAQAGEEASVSRQVIFRYFAWIALLCAIAGVSAVMLFATAEKMLLIGSILAAAIGFCYFVQQQKLAETVLFKDLFTDFNQRYDALNDQLVKIAASAAQLTPAERQIIVDYFNLCAEEYLFYSEGYIHPTAWRSWCAGMLWYFDREPFRSVWRDESATKSYYGLSVDAIRHAAA